MKRFFTRFLLLVILLIGTATVWAQKSVLDENFANGKPSDWTTAGNYWKFQDGNAKFEALVQNGVDTLFTPQLDISSLDNKPSVAITYRNTNNNAMVNTLKVLYRTTPTGAWSVLKTFDTATDGQVTWKDELPTGLSSVQIALAGAYLGGAETRVYRLAVENKTEATDAPTGLRCEDLKTSSVTLWWTPCSSIKFVQYNVKVSTTQLNDPAAAPGNIADMVGWGLTDEWYELDGLTPNTEYWLYVQYDCGDGDVSPWAEAFFRTPCITIGVPFSEDFEDGLSTCFAIIKEGSVAAVSSEYPYKSTKSFKSYSVKSNYNYLILPEFNGVIKNFQVSFAAAAMDGGNTYARTIAIGVCTDASAESFTEVKTLSLPKGRTWESIVVSLKGYTGTGKYIAFKLGSEEKENRLFIDDIHVEAASECPKPMFVEVSEITPNSAKLKWEETGNANEWNLAISTKPLADPEDLVDIVDPSKGEFIDAVSANPYTVTGLNANTTYYAYVQAGCGSSGWTNAVEFKTAKAVTYPYVEAFDKMDPDKYTNDIEAIPDSWVMDGRCVNPDNAGGYFDHQISSYFPYVSTDKNISNSPYVAASLLLRGSKWTGSLATHGQSSVAMLPAMPKDVKQMQISFYAYTENSNTKVVVGVANEQTNEKEKGQQMGVNIQAVDTIDLLTDWNKYATNLSAYSGTGRYIVLYLLPSEDDEIKVYIDDITVEDIALCNAVTNLAADITSGTSVRVSWTDNTATTTQWRIKVASSEIDAASEDGDIVANATASKKEYDVSGLTMGSTCHIYVSPACGDQWEHISKDIPSGLYIPYFNDFTDETTGKVAARGPKDWIKGNTSMASPGATNDYWPYIYATAWSTASATAYPAAWAAMPTEVVKNSLYLYNNTTTSNQYPYAIMPQLMNADIQDVVVSFYYYTDATTNISTTSSKFYSELKVGVVSDPSNVNTTDKFDNVTNVTTIHTDTCKIPQYVVIDMSAAAGKGQYIVFYQEYLSTKTNKSYIDNLSISLKTEPQAVTNVAVSSISTTGAIVSWTENGTATKWELRVFDAIQEDPEEGTPLKTYTVNNTPSQALSGLSPSTRYFVYVRSKQDNGNGKWGEFVGATTFVTSSGNANVPFSEDWENYTTSNTKWTDRGYDVTAGVSIGNYASSNVDSELRTGNVIKLVSSATNTIPMIVFPAMNASINSLQLTMKASPTGASYVGNGSYTEIGVVDGDNNFHVVAEYRFNLGEIKKWDDVFVDFSGYTGPTGRIAIRSPYVNSIATSICFDNVVIDKISTSCKRAFVSVSEITYNSAKLAWEQKGTEAWNVKVSATYTADPVGLEAELYSGKVTNPALDLSDLPTHKSIHVYMQTVDENNNCTGDWYLVKAFQTECGPFALPYANDYESFTNTGTGAAYIPECSNVVNAGGAALSNIIAIQSNAICLNTKALRLTNNKVSYATYYSFPEMAEAVKNLELKMRVFPGSTTANNKYYYEVGVMTDPSDPNTFISVVSEAEYISATGTAGKYEDKKFSFAGYAGDEHGVQGKYIAIRVLDCLKANGTDYTSGQIYIDNVVIDKIQTCAQPNNVQGTEIEAESFKLTWETTDDAVTHRVRLFSSADAKPEDEGAVEKVVTGTEVSFAGLTPNTLYYAFVRMECSATDKSQWSDVQIVRTDCGEGQILPYSDDFESYADGSVPACWKEIDGTNTNAQSRVRANGNLIYASSGVRGLAVVNGEGGSTGGSFSPSSIITPKLDVATLKDLIIYMDIRSTKAGGTLQIEAYESQDVASAKSPITTLSDISTSWSTICLDLNELYQSDNLYKYICFTSPNNGVSICIDNLYITNDITAIPAVKDLKARAVSDKSITFSFVEPTPRISKWEMAYGLSGVAIGDATKADITATTHTITGLSELTAYDIYVRAKGTQKWIGPLRVSTIAPAAQLPYVTGFEDATDNAEWKLVSIADGVSQKNYFIIGDADKCEGAGEKALFVTDNNADWEYMASVSSVWAIRAIEIPNNGNYYFRFKLRVEGENKGGIYPAAWNDNVSVALVPAGSTYSGSNITLISGEKADKITLLGATEGKPEWEWISQVVDLPAGVYEIGFNWKNIATTNHFSPVAIDSVMVEEYLCNEANQFEFAEKTSSSVSLTWRAGSCKNFEYVVSRFAHLSNPAAVEVEDKVAEGSLNAGPEITISNLVASTDYSFYVRTVCPEGYTDWVEFRFRTACDDEILPYTESFPETPECWALSNATATTVQYQTDEMKTAGENPEIWPCLAIEPGGYAVLPQLDVPLNNVSVEIAAFNQNYAAAVSVGIVGSAWNVSGTWEEMRTFAPEVVQSSWNSAKPYDVDTFQCNLNKYIGSGKYIALRNTSSATIYVRYIKLTKLPDCVNPYNFEMASVTENSATVSWQAGGFETEWEIKLNDDDPFKVTEKPYTIQGLEQGTEYVLYVRAVCDEEHKSEWTGPITVLTACGANPLPLFEDFSGIQKDRALKLSCWENKTCDMQIEDLIVGRTTLSIVPVSLSGSERQNYWTANYTTRLGDCHQLVSRNYRYGYSRYNWFISPKYAIEGTASLSFDARLCDSNGKKAVVNKEGRFFVAISTDNGETWTQTINMTSQLDTVYKNFSVSLAAYSGQAIRVAFYHENVHSGTTSGVIEYLLIDNVRMNCTETYPYADNACQGVDYEGYGFSIAKEDMPIAGEDSTYYRFAANTGLGCDSTVALTLTTRVAKTQTVYETICQGETYNFGPYRLSEPSSNNPGGAPYYITGETKYGCDSTIYLYLTVNESDTTVVDPIVKLNTELPFQVDDYYTIPANTPVSSFDTIVKISGCSFNRYTVTITQCTQPYNYSADLCSDQTSYSGYGFNIATADLPAPGNSKEYTRNNMNAQGCDSVITLTLTMHAVKNTALSDDICEDQTSYSGNGFTIAKSDWPAVGQSKSFERTLTSAEGCDSIVSLTLTVTKADTTDIPVAIENTALPYYVDAYYTVPANATIGTPFEVIKKAGDCVYNRYLVSITQCTAPYSYSETICEGLSGYEGYGFTIASNELPAPNTSKEYARQNMNAEGCDSIITLTLTAHNDTTDIPVSILKDALPYVVDAYYTVPADAPISTPFEEVVKETNTDCSYRRYSVMVSSCSDTYNYSDNICEDQTSYSGYGFNIAAVNLPAPGASKDYTRNAANTAGCDSVITLTLTVNIGDTTDVAVNKLNTELPFAVDEYYTVPADATIGTPFEVVKKMGDTGCSFKRYMVTISQCTQSFDYSDNICSDQTSYSGYGFSIALNELPAPGNSKEFNRNAKDENGCDSVITFTLAVTLNDTTDVIVTKETTDLPYYVDEHYTVPADAIVGTPFEVIVKLSNADCSYNRYKVTISDVSTGWTNLTDAIDHIEIYDALGHRITIISAENTLRQIQLPAGVYMQRVVMRNGNAQTGKFVIR